MKEDEMCGACSARERMRMHSILQLKNLKERDQWGDISVDGRKT
jgi:hypothetical protein